MVLEWSTTVPAVERPLGSLRQEASEQWERRGLTENSYLHLCLCLSLRHFSAHYIFLPWTLGGTGSTWNESANPPTCGMRPYYWHHWKLNPCGPFCRTSGKFDCIALQKMKMKRKRSKICWIIQQVIAEMWEILLAGRGIIEECKDFSCI